MGMMQEFKSFAMRGNVVDMAVGVIIGGAFGKIVNSVIEDLIMPVVGKAVGNVDFSNLFVPLSDKITSGLSLVDAKKLGPVFAYGNFLTILINFIILAFCIFLMIKAMNSMKKKEEAKPAAPAEPPAQERLLAEIRDLLRKR
jgi:large conductance mechanosensitive channel